MPQRGFCPIAQGRGAAATLGNDDHINPNPDGVVSPPRNLRILLRLRNPFGVDGALVGSSFTQGSGLRRNPGL